jgi:hypothetical protein
MILALPSPPHIVHVNHAPSISQSTFFVAQCTTTPGGDLPAFLSILNQGFDSGGFRSDWSEVCQNRNDEDPHMYVCR